MGKIAAYYPIHYGKEYLHASLVSVLPCVDKVFILYSSKPTYGHDSNIQCPESEEEIKAIAVAAAKEKLEWINITEKKFSNEGAHRHYIFSLVQDYDQLLSVDADEVWDTEKLRVALQQAATINLWRINVSGWLHFWRSFDWYNTDTFVPHRITNLQCPNKCGEGVVEGLIYHFGYAQNLQLMAYKWKIHGHLQELRQGWFDNVFSCWKEGICDLHPTSAQIWNKPLRFDKTKFPPELKSHENFHKVHIV